MEIVRYLCSRLALNRLPSLGSSIKLELHSLGYL